MSNSIVTIELDYNVKDDKTTFLDTTTAKPEAIAEILEAYIRSQIGAGEDTREAAQRDTYRIKLMLDLDGDVFRVKHDCGNEGLCLGILLTTLRRLP